MSPTLEVVRAGALATIQDNGRPASTRHGVPRGGAMDRFALLAANRLLGNQPDAAVIEITAGGAAFVALRLTLLAIAGADMGARLAGAPLRPWTAALARPGELLELPARTADWGARAYLAIGGGVDTPLVLGSRSTHLPGGFGGFAGRPLRAGDQIAAGPVGGDPLRVAGRHWPATARPAYGPNPTLRFVAGPHTEQLRPEGRAALAKAWLRVGESSNRMGYRLEGALLPYLTPVSLPSLGVIPGVVQVPPDGAPILLMADAQTTGGYPILGVVIAPDLPLAAQLLPGDSLRLTPISLDAALAARRGYAAWCAHPLEPDDDQLQLGLTGDGGL